MTRDRVSGALAVLACVAIVLALIAGYVNRAAVDSDQFANRATAALRDEAVRDLIGQRITDEVILRKESDLIAARPIIESVASEIVGGRAFTAIFRAGVRDAHRALFSSDQRTVTLTLPDVGTVIASTLEAVRPSLAKQVRATGRIEIVRRHISTWGAKAAHFADTVRILTWLLTAVAVILVAGSLALSPNRRRTVARLGTGVAIGGIALVVAYSVLRGIALRGLSGDARAAAAAVWKAFLGDLRTASWILAATGAVVAASAASLLRPVEIGEPLRRAGRWIAAEPQRPGWRVVRGAVLIAVGIAVILARDTVVDLAVTLAGVYLIYGGVSAIQWVIYRPQAKEAQAEDEPRPSRPGFLTRHRALAVATLAIVLVAGATSVFVGAGGMTTKAPAAGPCNGYVELCDRPFDEVALPATHNAMSVPLPGWYSAEQDHPIAQQLRDGIRGLLVDTHYADRLPNGRLRTDVATIASMRRKLAEDGVSPEAADAAMRIRDRVGFSGEGERGMYLCHSLCELGGTSLSSALQTLHDFLVAHPDEIVVVINQDYVTPADFVKAVDDAGLGSLAYRGPVDGRWPTLREMIDSNQRVVFFAENRAGGAPWYRLAYEKAVQETPYHFSQTSELTAPSGLEKSCRPNRGPADAPLFLVNHWVTTTPVQRPSDAARVNAYEPLLARMRECERVRHHIPNLVAVNFYKQGDVFRVVDTLNGTSPKR